MALKLFNPKTRAFVSYTASDAADLPLSEMLLLNILIELQMQTELMVQANGLADSPEALRSDIVSN